MVEIQVNATTRGRAISKHLWGIFYEDLQGSVDGGSESNCWTLAPERTMEACLDIVLLLATALLTLDALCDVSHSVRRAG